MKSNSKRRIIRYVIRGSFDASGKPMSKHFTIRTARTAAVQRSRIRSVDIWTITGGMFGLGKPVAHYSEGKEIK